MFLRDVHYITVVQEITCKQCIFSSSVHLINYISEDLFDANTISLLIILLFLAKGCSGCNGLQFLHFIKHHLYSPWKNVHDLN